MYVGDTNGVFYAMDVSSEKILWRFQAENEGFSPSVAIDKKVVFGSVAFRDDGTNWVYALNAMTGELIWKITSSGRVVRAPVVNSRSVYFAATHHELDCVDSETGELKWKIRPAMAISSGLLIANGLLLWGSSDGGVIAVDVADGGERWKFKTKGSVRATPIHEGGVVFVGSLTGYFYAIDANTGKQKWRAKADGTKAK